MHNKCYEAVSELLATHGYRKIFQRSGEILTLEFNACYIQAFAKQVLTTLIKPASSPAGRHHKHASTMFVWLHSLSEGGRQSSALQLKKLLNVTWHCFDDHAYIEGVLSAVKSITKYLAPKVSRVQSYLQWK